MFDFFIYLLGTLVALTLCGLIAIATAYLIMMRRMTLKIRDTIQDIERQLSQAVDLAGKHRPVDTEAVATCVPPMRIHLENTASDSAIFGRIGQQAETWLRQREFRFAGQFVIEELGHEQLRVFLSGDSMLLAAVRLPVEAAEPYVEFCFDLGGGQIGGVANPPDATIVLPADAVGKFYAGSLCDNLELLDQMWSEAKALIADHETLPVEENRVAELYETAHACEMDFRIEQGGVSEYEIRQSLLSQGIEACEEDIVAIQEQWQAAIEEHLLDFSSRALNHAHAGRQILIVHNGSIDNYLLHRIRTLLQAMQVIDHVDAEELRESLSELSTLLARFSPREAISRFRALLPEPIRYNLVDQLHYPIEADLYVLPKV